MAKFIRLLVITGLAALLAGCPLTTKYSLGPSMNAPMDRRLLGTWVFEKGSIEYPADPIVVFAFNRTEYLIESKSNDGKKRGHVRAYVTVIDNTSFLNFQDLRDSREEFNFYNYSFSSDNTLFIRVVDEQLFPNQPSSSAELNKLIKKNLRNPGLYGDNAIFRRIE